MGFSFYFSVSWSPRKINGRRRRQCSSRILSFSSYPWRTRNQDARISIKCTTNSVIRWANSPTPVRMYENHYKFLGRGPHKNSCTQTVQPGDPFRPFYEIYSVQARDTFNFKNTKNLPFLLPRVRYWKK